MLPPIPKAWMEMLGDETRQSYFGHLGRFLADEMAGGRGFLPDADRVFAALEFTAPEQVRVVLLGQDPYPTPGDAHGLCFSVPSGRPIPRSLRNIYKELATDVGARSPAHGNLESWARQGVLLLNTVLTVQPGAPLSHRGRGWEIFTDCLISRLNERPGRIVFMLWGNQAQKKRALISAPHHAIVATAHPSPLSARLFLGSRPFSAANHALTAAALPPIDWQLPEA